MGNSPPTHTAVILTPFDLRETLSYEVIYVPDHESKLNFSISHDGDSVRPLSIFEHSKNTVWKFGVELLWRAQ